ncbi:MAG: class I SAM-dependent rRNA methyltransferase, partial [Kiloniellales bacterium]|nr:class I SAM-dependent rRNA methyltransferase [Kiloniellales bacterium]
FNRHALISLRLLDRAADRVADEAFFLERLTRALALRESLFDEPFYRLVHAEADGLPGLIIDRFGQVMTLQANCAGMERATPAMLAALDRLLAPETIVLKNDSTARKLEGLETHVEVVRGELRGPIELRENGAIFFADPRDGQKTGWFYDQRENRAWAAGLAADRRVLDCYSYTGGFGIQAARAGAIKVTFLDRSESALALAEKAADANGVGDRCRFNRGDAFNRLELLGKRGEAFDLVICDPPAFVKAKKDLPRGAKAYRKLARLSAACVDKGGFLVICSCSHHMEAGHFLYQVQRGLSDAGRRARVLKQSGAAADHPLHPSLPESGYLKALFIALD